MNLMNIIKRIIRQIFNAWGFDVVRLHKIPQNTLLGLKSMSIKTIIDVGASTGQFAKMIEKIFPEAYIYCFEPVPEPFKKLDKWTVKKNRKVKVFNLALGDSEEEIEMFYHTGHSPSSSLLKTTEICEKYYPFTKDQQTIKVKITTLDKVIDKLNIFLVPEILIKLDVQGYEEKVIRGGKLTFAKAKACIVEICLDKLYENQAEFKEITELLYDLGFKYAGNLNQNFADDGHVIFIDVVFVR